MWGSNKITLCESTLLINILCKCKIDFNPRLIQVDTPFDLKRFPYAFQSLLLISLDMGPLGQEDICLSGPHGLAFFQMSDYPALSCKTTSMVTPAPVPFLQPLKRGCYNIKIF